MPLRSRKKQLVIAKETSAGTLAAGIGSAANATLLVEEPTMVPEVEFVERNFLYDSQTDTADAAGLVTGRFSFRTELRGTLEESASLLPAWNLAMEICGLRGQFCDIYTIGAITGGPFRHGEVVTQTTSNATARVMHDTFTGNTSLIVEPISGTPTATDIWTGGSTGATATPSARTAAGAYTWYPWKEVVKVLDITAAAGGDGWAVGSAFKGNTSNARGVVWKAIADADTKLYYQPIRGTFTAGETLARLDGTGGTEVAGNPTNEGFHIWPTASLRLYEDGNATTMRGCRGNMEIRAQANRPALLTFTGVGIMDRDTGVDDAVQLSGIDYQFGRPPIFENSAIGFADETIATKTGEAEPELQEITFNLGNEPALRIHAGAAGGAVEAFVGATRAATGSIDPEATLEQDTPLDFRTKFVNGTVCRLNFTVGSTDANRFLASMPGIQFNGFSRGDRTGILTSQLPFKCTGGEIGNLAGGSPTITSIGGENEIVLTYFLDLP